MIKQIDALTLKNWLDKGEAVLVDVREPAEYQEANIPGSQLIPLATLSVSKLPVFLGKKLVVHCARGRRGCTACEKLLAENPALEVYNLEGGISAWVQANYPVQCRG